MKLLVPGMRIWPQPLEPLVEGLVLFFGKVGDVGISPGGIPVEFVKFVKFLSR
jgi:hypothetical protein